MNMEVWELHVLGLEVLGELAVVNAVAMVLVHEGDECSHFLCHHM